MTFEKIVPYLSKKYDIDGNVYELIASMPVSRELILQNVNDDTHINRNAEKFDFESYIRN